MDVVNGNDVVCGMAVDPATKHRSDHAGKAFYFCSVACQTRFDAEPQRYFKPKETAAGSSKDETIYTCPMHPQIRQADPGPCPICGMALEPLMIVAATAPNRELTDMFRRFWIGLALTLPVFILEMGSHVPWLGLKNLVPEQWSIWFNLPCLHLWSCGPGGRFSSVAQRRCGPDS